MTLMISLESDCLDQVFRLRHALAGTQENAKKTFKLVNAMLQVLDRDGLYGAVVYLEAYRDKKRDEELTILSGFNRIMNKLMGSGLFPQDVSPDSLATVKAKYIEHRLADEGDMGLVGEQVLRRLLVHLRFETKAGIAK